MALYRAALGYCASNAGFDEEAVPANQRALELEPENQELVNDLGWTLFRAGRFVEGRETLERAVSMDPSNQLASENLRLCMREIAGRKSGKAGKSQAARRGPHTLR